MSTPEVLVLREHFSGSMYRGASWRIVDVDIDDADGRTLVLEVATSSDAMGQPIWRKPTTDSMGQVAVPWSVLASLLSLAVTGDHA